MGVGELGGAACRWEGCTRGPESGALIGHPSCDALGSSPTTGIGEKNVPWNELRPFLKSVEAEARPLSQGESRQGGTQG